MLGVLIWQGMSQDFQPGDFLVFQLESGYGLLRILDIENGSTGPVWHVSAYEDLFIDTETADMAIQEPGRLTTSHPHIALTDRAFLSTQTARMSNAPLTENELSAYRAWQADPDRSVSDRSVRLILGLR